MKGIVVKMAQLYIYKVYNIRMLPNWWYYNFVFHTSVNPVFVNSCFGKDETYTYNKCFDFIVLYMIKVPPLFYMQIFAHFLVYALRWS